MKTIKYIKTKISLVVGILLLTISSCERDLSEDFTAATFPSTAEVFTDAPVGLGSNFYFPFLGSKLDAFSVDNEVGFESAASFRVDVPNSNDPSGNFAGAIIRVDGIGRDLSGYDALTFYAKASQGVTVDEIGFGQDFITNTHQATVNSLSIGTNWTKYVIPIPDPSRLVEERGVFWYAMGTQGTGGSGYIVWFDEIKFERLGTIAHPRPSILGGNDESITTVTGAGATVTNFTQTFNLENGQDVTVIAAPGYFNFTSSSPGVATVDGSGNVSVVGSGTTTIEADVAGVPAVGSLAVESIGPFTSAPIPSVDPANVISIFSDDYTNIPVDFYTSNYAPFQSTTSSHFQATNSINGNPDNVLNYLNFNFVGIEFNAGVPTVDASSMTNLHLNVYVPAALPPGSTLRVKLRDVGANGMIETDPFTGNPTGDDSEINTVIVAPTLVSGSWITVDFDITPLSSRANLGQIVFDSTTGIAPSTFFVDNIYFYGLPTAPSDAAPTPTLPAANVISMFSDAYTDVPVDTWRTGWSNATFQDVMIAGNPTKEYTNLAFNGIETVGTPIDASGMTHFHMDIWTPNITAFRIKLVDFLGNGFGNGDTEGELTFNPAQGQWVSLDIPLSDFGNAGMSAFSDINQLIISGDPAGQGIVYVDNVYFHN